MAESMFTNECKSVNPPREEVLYAAIASCRAEMARVTAAAEWRELVAECAARGMP